jgi:hypothetical protein
MAEQEPSENLSVEVYKDAGKPAAEEFGRAFAPAGKELGETLTRTVHVALAPLRGLIWSYEQIGTTVIPLVAEKLKKRTDRVVPPKAIVAAPAIEALRYAGSEPPLRDMYVNLLATAMDAKTAESAHPAFVDIIRQMTPDEAVIVSHFRRKQVFPVYTVTASFPERSSGSYRVIPEALSIIKPEDDYRRLTLIPIYLDNLCRLQLTG